MAGTTAQKVKIFSLTISVAVDRIIELSCPRWSSDKLQVGMFRLT